MLAAKCAAHRPRESLGLVAAAGSFQGTRGGGGAARRQACCHPPALRPLRRAVPSAHAACLTPRPSVQQVLGVCPGRGFRGAAGGRRAPPARDARHAGAPAAGGGAARGSAGTWQRRRQQQQRRGSRARGGGGQRSCGAVCGAGACRGWRQGEGRATSGAGHGASVPLHAVLRSRWRARPDGRAPPLPRWCCWSAGSRWRCGARTLARSLCGTASTLRATSATGRAEPARGQTAS